MTGTTSNPAQEMTDLPLDRFRLFDSDDVDDTREKVARVFCDHEMGLVGRDARLNTRMNCRRIDNLAIAAITYGGDVRVQPDETETFFPVMALLTGKGSFQSGNEQLHASPGLTAVASPTLPLSMRLVEGTKLLIARIERPALEAKLREMLGESLPWPLEFTLGMNTTKGYGRSWHESFTLCVNELDRPDSMMSNTLAARGFEQGLMEGLLFAQPSNYSRLLEGDTRPVPNRAVNVAIDLMQAHPEFPHTIGSLAGAAGVSVRALQEGFRRHKGVPPLVYLRDVRLRRAHDALRAAQPGTKTVGEIAAEWGFPHLSRFAGWYRERFGESPSRTLHR